MIYALSTTIAMIIIIAIFAQLSTSRSVLNVYKKQLEQIETIVDHYYADPSSHYVFTCHPEDRFLIMDMEQNVVLDSLNDKSELIGSKLHNTTLYKVYSGETIQEVSSFGNTFQELKVMTAIPLMEDGQVTGAVLLLNSYEAIKDDMTYIYKLLAVCLVVIVIVTFGSTYGFTNIMSNSFKEFSDTTQRIANGDFSSRVNGIHDGELGELSRNLNYMAEELEKLEDYRKDFLANVSHDIRSPLTTIRGFVQAMMDGTIPVDNQEKYFRIVLNETDRLTKMTNDILLLSKMENQKIKLHITTIDINAIIIRVLDQFEQSIKKKRMALELNLYDGPLLVDVDANHIQRVVANLLDNAIKFCAPGDTITITVGTIYNKAEISIADSGPGIPKEELPYIWDRFHKIDKSRGQDKQGIGLGLSIIKEILRTHGESINVYSDPSLGTRFVFTLPLHNGIKKG